MPSTRYLVLIETAGNQGFIFATNKLRENVGASQMTRNAGTEFVNEPLRSFGVLNKDILVRTSGKAMFLVESEGVAKKIIGQVTKTAIEKAPGLDLRGAYVECDVAIPATIHIAVKQVHDRHAELASFVPGPRERFLRLPVVADCRTSGLPAMMMGKEGREEIPISNVTNEKRKAAEAGWQRIRAEVKAEENRFQLARRPDELDDLDLDWHAVIHADGNGLGQLFLDFHKFLPGGETGYNNADYVRALKAVSDGLDECTLKAFCTALKPMAASWKPKGRTKYLPIVPLVLGGDDLTVVCDGQHAVQLARDFLRAFERETNGLAKRAGLVKAPPEYFSACAGVAIVKPHYPFYAAYELAEELLRSAKKVAKKVPNALSLSALDFHILYDASSSKLETIRNKLGLRRFVKPDGSVDYRTKLVARPYIVTPNAEPKWRHTDDLDRRVRLVRGSEDGPRPLPRGMLHELREGLFLGVEVAEARLRLARGRHAEALDTLLPEQRLFFQDGADHSVTSFLDALDLAEFWETEDQS